ncbi:MAG: TetR/AcrR family transcriptional regulator [Gemmatimonadales bacterium]
MSEPLESTFQEPPRWQRRPTERRREILDAAALVFGEHGFDAATIADVATRAGVSPGTVIHYFGSKAALFEGVMADRLFPGMEEDEALLISHRGSYGELLRELLRRMWERLNRPGTAELILVGMAQSSSAPGAGQAVSGEMVSRCPRLLRGVIEAGVQSGEFRTVDPAKMAKVLAGSVLGLVVGCRRFAPLTQTPMNPEEVFTELLELVGIGLGS